MGSIYHCIKHKRDEFPDEDKDKYKNKYIKDNYNTSSKVRGNKMSSFEINKKINKIYENEPILIESEVNLSNKLSNFKSINELMGSLTVQS